MSEQIEQWFHYDFALIRVVPRVHRADCQSVGVIIYAPTERYLAARFIQESEQLHPNLRAQLGDPRLFERYLRSFQAIVSGDAAAGPIARLSQSERFHWLSAPRSDIFQPAEIHHGRCRDLAACVDELFEDLVG